MRLIGSFQTMTTHGRSGTTTSSSIGSSTSTGVTVIVGSRQPTEESLEALCGPSSPARSLTRLMSRLAKLSLVTTVLTFLAVTAGGLVRATGSGLGCPGWPKCYGRWIPPADEHAIIEWNHRFLVQLAVWLAVAVLVSVLIWHRRERLTLRLGVAIVPLFVAQAALGAYVVGRELIWWSVVGHLALAMILMATLIVLTVHLSAGAPREPSDRSFTRLVVATGAATYVLLLLGSTVTGKGAGLAYRDWPLMNGTAIPSNLDRLLPFLQFSHRIVAVLVAVLAAWVVVRAWRSGPGAVR